MVCDHFLEFLSGCKIIILAIDFAGTLGAGGDGHGHGYV